MLTTRPRPSRRARRRHRASCSPPAAATRTATSDDRRHRPRQHAPTAAARRHHRRGDADTSRRHRPPPAATPAGDAALRDGKTLERRRAHDRHRRSGVPAVRHRRRPRVGRGLRGGARPGRRSRAGLRGRRRHVGAHLVRQPRSPAATATSTSTCSSSRSTPSAQQVVSLQRRRTTPRTRPCSATPTARPQRVTKLSDLKALKLGAAAATTSLQFIIDVIQPDAEPFAFNSNADAKTALDNEQIDAIITDLPTGLYISAVEIEGTKVFGQFPVGAGGAGDQWGLLFAKDNPLVECADLALAALTAVGRARRRSPSEWMGEYTEAPTLSPRTEPESTADSPRRASASAPARQRAPHARLRRRGSVDAPLVAIAHAARWRCVGATRSGWPKVRAGLLRRRAVPRRDFPELLGYLWVDVKLFLCARRASSSWGWSSRCAAARAARRCSRCGCSPPSTPTCSAACPIILTIYLVGFGIPKLGLRGEFTFLGFGGDWNSPYLWGPVALILAYSAYVCRGVPVRHRGRPREPACRRPLARAVARADACATSCCPRPAAAWSHR